MTLRFLCLAAVLMLTACHGDTPSAAADEPAKTAEAEAPTRTTIREDIARQSGIVVTPAGPGTVRDEHTVQGLLVPIEGRDAKVSARFPGPIRAVRAEVGDTVRAGQPLATVESNISLSDYTVAAPFAGTVIARDAAVGDIAGQTPLFEVADLAKLWVDLHVFGADAQHLRAGLPVKVIRLSDGQTLDTTIDRILPGTATASQSTIARAVIDNADGHWRPGSAVQARVAVAAEPVALAVPLTAVQDFRGHDTVFVKQGDTYVARPVTLGRRDAEKAEVREGLKRGELVVTAESYLIKADLDKSSVEED
jgi:membrane fusion protein, heavy metal efflux system